MERDKNISIYRKTASERKEGGFTMVPNSFIDDNMLTTGAFKLMVYALSKPNDWQFFATNTARECFGTSNRTRLNKELRILVSRGWALGSFQDGVIFLEKNYCEMDEEEQTYLEAVIAAKKDRRGGVYGNHTGEEVEEQAKKAESRPVEA